MDELIRINFDSDCPTVSGRELHAALEINTKYADWFTRMCEYGFAEPQDYFSILRNRSDGLPGKPMTDHQLTIDMAKQLCMIQRTEIGRQFRQYFIKVEESWNSPEAVMARALQFANQQLALMKHQNAELLDTDSYGLHSNHRPGCDFCNRQGLWLECKPYESLPQRKWCAVQAGKNLAAVSEICGKRIHKHQDL